MAEDIEGSRNVGSGSDHSSELRIETLAIHGGQNPAQWSTRDVIPPISVSTTFAQTKLSDPLAYHYSRMDNPTRHCLEICLAPLEKARFAVCYASGLAALSAILHTLKSGDHIITSQHLYGGANRQMVHCASPFGLQVDFVDTTELENIAKSLKANTKLVYVETPSNPLMAIVDIAGVASLLKKHASGAKLAVDNTFMSPYFQNPLVLGADIVMHSATKYLSGHSDTVMGCLMTNDQELYTRLRLIQNTVGAVPSPFDCFLVLRGIKTLTVRMERHHENGLKIARYLEKHPQVERVVHPGLQSHLQYALANKQSRGCSGMLSFFVKGGEKECRALLLSLKIFAVAESLGSVESLASFPLTMSHATVSPEQRAKMGITPNLIRLSIGLENADDLINDLDAGLKEAAKAS